MSKPIIHEAERFVLRAVEGGVQTQPQGAQYPLLARLHAYDEYDPSSPPAAVTETVDTSDVAPGLSGAARLQALAQRVLEISGSHDLVTRIVEQTPEQVVFELRDARAVEMEGAVDLREAAAAAGLPLAAQLLADGRVVLATTPRCEHLVRLEGDANAGAAADLAAAAVKALQAAYPTGGDTYFSLADFLAKRGHETPWAFGRALYKYTDCGPWTSFIAPGAGKRGQVYYESKEAAEPNAAWWADCIGLQIGSIVEGSDAEVQPESLYWPITVQQLDRAVENIDAEASRLWDEANAPEHGDTDVDTP